MCTPLKNKAAFLQSNSTKFKQLEGDREGTGYHPSSHTPIHLTQFESTLLKSRQERNENSNQRLSFNRVASGLPIGWLNRGDEPRTAATTVGNTELESSGARLPNQGFEWTAGAGPSRRGGLVFKPRWRPDPTQLHDGSDAKLRSREGAPTNWGARDRWNRRRKKLGKKT
ncbi:hypothetical protein AAHA92_22488 [Salvia divinorum]|uniref:Uncharacterized protein n=1 Tax=Salvia divinorum TaxID=28513 RepID=A0ABD1GP66_SALDI